MIGLNSCKWKKLFIKLYIKIEFDKSLAESARLNLLKLAASTPVIFEDDDLPITSEALPAIWQNWDDFVSKSEDLEFVSISEDLKVTEADDVVHQLVDMIQDSKWVKKDKWTLKEGAC